MADVETDESDDSNALQNSLAFLDRWSGQGLYKTDEVAMDIVAFGNHVTVDYAQQHSQFTDIEESDDRPGTVAEGFVGGNAISRHIAEEMETVSELQDRPTLVHGWAHETVISGSSLSGILCEALGLDRTRASDSSHAGTGFSHDDAHDQNVARLLDHFETDADELPDEPEHYTMDDD